MTCGPHAGAEYGTTLETIAARARWARANRAVGDAKGGAAHGAFLYRLLWDQSDQHIRWVIAASASVAIGHAAMDAAIANYPEQRFTLRNGILVIRQHPRT